jgi:hypothetical protein
MEKSDFFSIKPNRAAGDIGSELVFIQVPQQSVVSFKTTTRGLKACVSYLLDHGIDCVAVEATGVYWINFFDHCESAGIDTWLVNPKYTKSRAGKKTDVADSIWIQHLHSADLLEKSFIPNSSIRAYREYVRTRENYIEDRVKVINRMNKALIQMNVRIDTVISQIHGVSGMKMIESILAGERDPEQLIELCDTRIKKNKHEDLKEALEGNFADQYLYTLGQAVEDFKYYDKKIKSCDNTIENQLREISKGLEPPKQINKPKPIRHNKPQIADLQLLMQTITGLDLSLLPGITNYSLIKLTSELGVNVDPWPTKKHFTSFLDLAPRQNQSGRYNRKPKGRRKGHRAGQIFRQAAQNVINSKNESIGAFGRRLRARKGPRIAIKATARKLAELYYMLITKGEDYVDQHLKTYKQINEDRRLSYIEKQAKQMGMRLVKV